MNDDRQELADRAWLDAALDEQLGLEASAPPLRRRSRRPAAAALWLAFGAAIVAGVVALDVAGGGSSGAVQDPVVDDPVVEAVPAQVEVLYITGSPHWNYRYLESHLHRSEVVAALAC